MAQRRRAVGPMQHLQRGGSRWASCPPLHSLGTYCNLCDEWPHHVVYRSATFDSNDVYYKTTSTFCRSQNLRHHRTNDQQVAEIHSHCPWIGLASFKTKKDSKHGQTFMTNCPSVQRCLTSAKSLMDSLRSTFPCLAISTSTLHIHVAKWNRHTRGRAQEPTGDRIAPAALH